MNEKDYQEITNLLVYIYDKQLKSQRNFKFKTLEELEEFHKEFVAPANKIIREKYGSTYGKFLIDKKQPEGSKLIVYSVKFEGGVGWTNEDIEKIQELLRKELINKHGAKRGIQL